MQDKNDLTLNKMVEDQVLDLDAKQIVNRLVGRKIGLTNLLQNMTGEQEANLTLLGADQTEYIRSTVEQNNDGYWVYINSQCTCDY